MKKRIMIALFIIITLAISPVTTLALEEDSKIYIDGVEIKSDVSPINIQGQTFVPVHSLDWKKSVWALKLNFDFHWDAQSKTITIQNLDTKDTLVLTEGQTTAYKNNEPVQLATSLKIINWRIYVPLRFVAESFGNYVAYECDQEWCYNRIIVISKDKIEPYKILLNMEYDLAEARKIAIQLPFNTRSYIQPNTDNGEDYSYYYFPKGAALQYLYVNQDVKKYFHISNIGVKALSWEARYDEDGNIIEEYGQRAPRIHAGDKYFAESAALGKAKYGVIGENGEYIQLGESEFNPHDGAGSSIQSIPNEKRVEATAFPIIR